MQNINWNIVYWVAIGSINLFLFGRLIAKIMGTRTSGKRTRWFRKLYCNTMMKWFIDVHADQPILIHYPLIVYLSFDKEPREVYIEKGFLAVIPVINARIKTIAHIISDPEGYQKEQFERWDGYSPASTLEPHELAFIQQYEDAERAIKQS